MRRLLTLGIVLVLFSLVFMPAEATAADQPVGITHGDLATVAGIFGVSYVPPSETAPVTRGFAIAFLHRYRQRIEARRAGAVMHGFSESLAMDPGVDRAVSPSAFQ